MIPDIFTFLWTAFKNLEYSTIFYRCYLFLRANNLYTLAQNIILRIWSMFEIMSLFLRWAYRAMLANVFFALYLVILSNKVIIFFKVV